MKKYFYDEAKIINSPRKPVFTAEEVAYRAKVAQAFAKANTNLVCVAFVASDDNVYKVYMPIERLINQVKYNTNNARKSKWRFLSPISKAQAEMLIETGKAKQICTFEELKQFTAKVKNRNSNNGYGIEYALAKIEHKKFNHTLAACDGAEYDGAEVKFFDLRTGSGANATCPDYN